MKLGEHSFQSQVLSCVCSLCHREEDCGCTQALSLRQNQETPQSWLSASLWDLSFFLPMGTWLCLDLPPAPKWSV